MYVFYHQNYLPINLIRDSENIIVESKNTNLRKLYNPDKRIIFINLYPNFSQNIILEALKELNIILTSPI